MGHKLKDSYVITKLSSCYVDKLGKREERIRALDTTALIEEFKDKHSGNVALIRQELQDRYKSGRDRDAIALAFSNSIVSDQQWVKNQEKKLY